MWRRLERRIRVCRLSFRWIFCARERSFRLWILWFDLDSFSAVCVWICCFFYFLFDFRKLCEWESLVCVVLFSEKERIWNWKKNRFHFLFFCFIFNNSSIENLFAFVFFVFESNFVISFERSFVFLSSEKCEFIQREEKEFLDERIVIESDVSNLCETNNSSPSSLNKFCVEIVEIEKKKKEKKSFLFWILRYRLCLKWFLRRSNQKFVRRRFNHWKNSKISESCF